MDRSEIFAVNIRRKRKEQGLNQRQLAEKAGLKKSAISNYEQGTRRPDYETLVKIADALGCLVDELVREKEE